MKTQNHKSGKRGIDDTEEGISQADEDDKTFDLPFYKETLTSFVKECLEKKQRQRPSHLGSSSRDDYKIGMCFDRRKKIIAELIKLLAKKRCERCRAFSHRMRKDGHTKIMEYSLVSKQEHIHIAMNLHRPDVLAQGTSHHAKRPQTASNSHKRPRRTPQDEDEEDSGSDASSGGSRWAQNLNASELATVRSSREGQRANRSSNDSDEDSQEADQDADDSDVNPDADVTMANKNKKQTERMILAEDARAHLRRLFCNEREICDLLYGTHGPANHRSGQPPSPANADMFFLDVVSVPPTRFRPAAVMGGQTLEAPQNLLLGAILMQTVKVRDLNEKFTAASQKLPGNMSKEAAIAQKQLQNKIYSQILEGCIGMQIAVNSLMDSTKNPTIMAKGKLPPQGVKQILEKKEGLFRMNMMVGFPFVSFAISLALKMYTNDLSK